MTGRSGQIAVIGDCVLDVAVRAAAPGSPGADVDASITLGPGGQAANFAVRLARLGRPVRLVCALGDDAAGGLLRAALAAEGVELAALAAERTGIVTILVGADGERAMYSDRRPLDGAAAAAATTAAWVHISGYALLGPAGRALSEVLASRFVSVNGGSAAARDGRAAELREHLAILQPALVIVSLDEAQALLGDARGDGAASAIATRLAGLFEAVAVVTLGAAGAAGAVPEGIEIHVTASSGPAVDTTGAGDAFAAALVDRLAGDAGPTSWPPDEDRLRDAMAAAAELAGQVVGVVGAQTPVERERRGTVPA